MLLWLKCEVPPPQAHRFEHLITVGVTVGVSVGGTVLGTSQREAATEEDWKAVAPGFAV